MQETAGVGGRPGKSRLHGRLINEAKLSKPTSKLRLCKARDMKDGQSSKQQDFGVGVGTVTTLGVVFYLCQERGHIKDSSTGCFKFAKEANRKVKSPLSRVNHIRFKSQLN